MANSGGRIIRTAALERVVKRFDGVEATLVRKIVADYLHQLWVDEVAKNPAIQLLVSLPVGGRGVPWGRAVRVQRRPGAKVYYYVQTSDTERARAVLGMPDAKWEVYRPSVDYWRQLESEGKPTWLVRRVA